MVSDRRTYHPNANQRPSRRARRVCTTVDDDFALICDEHKVVIHAIPGVNRPCRHSDQTAAKARHGRQVKDIRRPADAGSRQIPRLERVLLQKPHPIFEQRRAVQGRGRDPGDGRRGRTRDGCPSRAVVQAGGVHPVCHVHERTARRRDVGRLPPGVGQARHHSRTDRARARHIVDAA